MKVFYNNDEICCNPKAVGLGNFDGLHKGHMTLVNMLISKAQCEGVKSMVYTFRQHPENVLINDHFTPLLTSVGKKVELLSKSHLDYLYFDEFDEQYSRMPPEDFVRDILMKKLGAKVVVAGFNYRFGHKGSGSLELLESLGGYYGYKLVVIPPVKIDDRVVSSTIIRDLLFQGEICAASRCLDRYYSLAGKVRPGNGRGSGLGYPTANLQLEDFLVIPARGVYLTKTKIEGTILGSITNIGTRPTFANSAHTSIETHVLDYTGNTYGKSIEVFFIKRLRDEAKFSSVEKLKERIASDIRKARQFHGGSTHV